MTKRIQSILKGKSRVKLTSLLLDAVLLVTSVSSVIALDVFDPAGLLEEQTFTLTPENGVTVTLNGLMPVRGHAEAVPADVEGEDVLHAYDITIYRADGSEFEPADGKPVAVSFKSSSIERAIADDSTSLTVGHIDDSGEETGVALTYAAGSEARFDAEAFSVYVIYEHEQDGDLKEPRKTFYFLSDKFIEYSDDIYESHDGNDSGLYESGLYKFPNTAGEMVSTQIVKNGETLHSIVMPDNSEFGDFYGWYIVDLDFEKSVDATIKHSDGAIPEGTELTADQLTHFVYSWGDDPVNVTGDTVIEVGEEDENVYLAPLFFNFRFVEFLGADNGSGQPEVAARKIVVMGTNHTATVKLSDVVAEPLPNSDEAFYGWEYNGHVYQTRLSTNEEVEQFLTLTDDDFPSGADTVNVTPVFKKTDFIVFDVQASNAEPVGSMHSFLYDPEVAEEDRATISQLPSTTRPGYIFDGWYAHFTDSNGQPVEQQVSMEKQSPDDTSASAIIPTSGNHIRIDADPDGSYLFLGKLYLRHGMTLYAHWREVNTADYKVVIWKQKVTDSKDASNSEKHYDYYSFTQMKNAPTGSVVLDLATYQARNFEGLAQSGNTAFDCFHYNRTEVVVNGNAYDGSIPSERAQGIVAPDDTTVVNVYYDRDLMTVRFDYTDGSHYQSKPDGDLIRIGSNYYSISSTKAVVESNGEVWYLSSSSSQSSATPYTGTIYTSSNGGGQTSAPVYGQTYYYKSGNKYYKLNWYKYNGERYTKSVEFTGLYEQTFAQNNCDWEQIASDVSWRDSRNITQTLLEGFTEKTNPYVLTQYSTPGNSIIYHYKQGTDGLYSTDARYIARGSGGTFNFSNKFRGFTVKGYSTGSNGFNPNGGNAIPSSGSVSNVNYPLHVYHERNKYELTFADYRTENNSPGESNDWVFSNVMFEKPLSEIIAENPALMDPPDRANYDFAGWYLDAACTREADFSTEIMPAANMILYAKWELKKYIVEIDPDGGEMQAGSVFSEYTGATGNGTEITYTRVQYGGSVLQPQNIERVYVPAHNGDYVYINVRLAPTIEAAGANWNKRLPEEYRSAFYCKLTDLETVYSTYFAGLESGGTQLLTHDDFMNYCVDNTQRYRKTGADETNGRYVLDGWRKVNADGTTSSEVYHFGDPVTKNTRVRAVWKRTGAYYLQYDPYDSRYNVGRDVMVDDTVMHNSTLYDPSDPNESSATGVTHYHDHAQAVVLQHPTYIPAHYIFRGWQLMTPDGDATGEYYSPGDTFTVDSTYSDNLGIIHFEAAYEPESESVRIVDTAGLILDANGGYAVRGGLDIYESSVYVDLDADQVIFKDQENNFKVHLSEYYNNFRSEQGYLLLGWSRTPNPENLIPEFAADAVIGIDTNDNEDDILYAVWEPMCYLTLENHSADYNITFDLKFTGYNGTVYSGDNNSVLSPYLRRIFNGEYTDDSILNVVDKGNNEFTVTIKKAPSSSTFTSVKLVLPQGVNSMYYVSGNLRDVKKDDNSSITAASNRDKFSVYNSGGKSEQLEWRRPSGWFATTDWYNLVGTQTTNYDVDGNMKLGSEGQKVAFYTGEPDTVDIYIQGLYYDLESGTWKTATEGQGPNATLNFEDVSGLSYDSSIGSGIMGISIIKNTDNVFSVRQRYTNTAGYKFIGWYDKSTAAPGDITLDGKAGLDGASKVSNIPVPNSSPKFYYALYVPKADGNLIISHDEKDTSIGYPKVMNVKASYNGGAAISDEVVTQITSVEGRTERAHTQISVPVSETDDPNARIEITLGVRSEYGCTHNDAYEGTHKLDVEAVIDQSAGTMNVYSDPNDTSSDYEVKNLWICTVTKTADELFEDSETIKGLKVLHPLKFYSDFNRKYEFVYNYIFRDEVTPRKYLVTGVTAENNSTEDMKRFVAESAPYVSNFGENLTWNTATIRVENLNGKGKVYATMDAAQYKNARSNVFVHSYGTSITETWTVATGDAFPENKRPTAPLIIDSGATPMQFYRWKITEAAKGSGNEGKFVAYCYFNEFTFKVWEDYDIVPEYVEMEGDEYHRYYPDDEQEAYVNISFLKNTRNQWVDLEDDNVTIKYDAEGNAKYNDALISDFSIIYIDHGLRIKDNADNYKVGLLYEIVGEVDDNGVTDPDSDYSETTEEYRKTVVNAVINGNKQNGSVKSGGKTKFYYSKFDPAGLTHDNRMEFYRGIDNLRSEDGLLNPNAKYIFKVYGYMKLSDGTILLSDSVTVQMYDLATRTSIIG